MVKNAVRTIAFLIAIGVAVSANAQLPASPVAPALQTLNNNYFPRQNPSGPTGVAQQQNYPYPGQCLANQTANGTLFPLLGQCNTAGSSFACAGATAAQTAGGWMNCGGPITFKPLNPVLPNSVPLAGVTATRKYADKLLNPNDYVPGPSTDVVPVTYTNADYYEIGLHEGWGFQAIATAGTATGLGLFPNPTAAGLVCGANCPSVPNGMQWTGLVCNATTPLGAATSCNCPAGWKDPPGATKPYCPNGVIPHGWPLFTQIWGVGQINSNGGPVTSTLAAVGSCSVSGALCFTNGLIPCPAPQVCNPTPLFTPGTPSTAAWSQNAYVATWPSISIRGTRWKPVVVKWQNEFPNNHVFCPHPEAADWPCAIDRTFMGVKARVDPGLGGGVPAERVNLFGSPQQPDNSWVTHLHGGEIPPSTDGFAEKWFGSSQTAPSYNANRAVNPPFENPNFITLKRPSGFSDTYTYPMVNDEATIWFHDHTLGKTHHNVIAGPAGFFPVKDPSKHKGVGNIPVANKACVGAAAIPATAPQGTACTSDYTWLDPVTEPRNLIGQPLYDLFLAVQDRSFNDDGSINFANGLGQVVPAGKGIVLPLGYSPVTSGVNPQVHPTWVPEYFGDHALVNGVLWPKNPTAPGWYRMRIVDGSDSRCWTVGFTTVKPAPGSKFTNNVPFYVIANDQGYLKNPVLAPANQFTMCPGERYELLVNFGAAPVAPPMTVYMTNSAPAPFPAGIDPFKPGGPYAEMNTIMSFEVNAANGAGVKTCGVGGAAASNSWDPTWSQAQMISAVTAGTACMPANPALVTDPNYAPQDARPAAWPIAAGTGIIRQIYMNERADGVTLAPMGMQLNGVPFEYKVTETPRQGDREFWQFINLTVDAHPMHPHLIKHQIVARQTFQVGLYKAQLCGSSSCQPGTAPGGEMQVVPDVTPFLTTTPVLVTTASVEGGFKDASQVPPGMVTTIVADWKFRWNNWNATPPTPPATLTFTAPGVCNAATCPTDGAAFVYEPAWAGPYVWHCHINSHEDSEMMRTSLVVPLNPVPAP